MSCVQCGNSDLAGAKFCPDCGTRVGPASERHRVSVPLREQMERLMEAALAAHESGNAAEAESICREAITLDPDCTSAHALLATLFEERGDLKAAHAEVLEVLRLNPTSRSDREWLHRLQEALHPPDADALPGALVQRRRILLAAGSLAAVLLGAAIALAVEGRQPAPTASSTVDTMQPAQSAVLPQPNPGSVAQNATLAPPGAVDNQAVSAAPEPAPAIPQANTPYTPNTPAASTPRSAPVVVTWVPPTGVRRADRPAGSGPQLGSVVYAAPRVAPPPPPQDQSAPPANFGDSMARAQQYFGGADYGRAINAYRDALRLAPSVLDAARVHQQLGMTYSSMGGPRAARAEFDVAESLYQSLASGPDADLARQAIANIEHQKQLLEPGS